MCAAAPHGSLATHHVRRSSKCADACRDPGEMTRSRLAASCVTGNVYCACSRRCSCAVVVLARRFPHLSRGQRGADAGCGSRNPRAAGARDGDAVSARPRSPRSAAAETRHFGRVETDAGAHAACSRSRAHARGSCTRMSVPVSGVQWSSRADSSEARDACRFSLHRHDVPALLALVPRVRDSPVLYTRTPKHSPGAGGYLLAA